MKSICAAAFLVLAAVACSKEVPVATTSTTSAEALPPADTNGTTPPPAVPELGKDGQGKARMSAKPRTMSTDDGVTSTSSIPTTDDSELTATPAETAVTPPVQGTTTTTTTTTVTTVKKKAPKPAGDYGAGAARGNGINSTGPVGNGGGGVR